MYRPYASVTVNQRCAGFVGRFDAMGESDGAAANQLFYHNDHVTQQVPVSNVYVRVRRQIDENLYLFSNAVLIPVYYNLGTKDISC